MHKLYWLPLSLSVMWQAQATQTHTISEQFPIASNQSLEISFPVGKLNVETYQGDSIQVNIELREKEEGWFGKTDLSAIRLERQQQNQEIYLTIDEETVEQTWHVKMPASLLLEAELGVGNINIDALANSAEIEVGVGNVKIQSGLKDYQSVELESGVGKTKLKNFSGKSNHEKSMVGSTTKYRGHGKYQLEVDVGVGNIKVTH
ncbi:hypothetical protein A7985_20050 [Pseudoalteromonas luteoviolacea]|uniref:Adhesin domain-containing protein n=1 Tax=Pseudoalteromonas luteoviolacea TaxID=43657 RepID=A0A1C0TLD6_9GAMM|nr:hypothetical protein [Pseudoalteromonas luteoviolacea]MBQ4813426.1 hypothetical protein [Pseudoalteromonas luteoviolacea]OCQ19709.1 hypothetical protein A7985_20050 [Pseudoalteromonas luteoviolacea]